MDRFGEANDVEDDEVFRSRYSYICAVIDVLARAWLSFPTCSQEKLYEDVLRHVGRLLSSSNQGKKAALRTCSCSCNCMRCSQNQKRSRKRTRKEVLKEILNLLLCLQRDRSYDPPADDEIRYYFLIKRYIRSIIAFFQPAPTMGAVEHGPGFKLFNCYQGIKGFHHMEELAELNQHLADLAEFVSHTDFTNGSSVTPLMGINEKIEAYPLIVGSKERSTAFYLNKFILAKFDLRSSEFAHCPPSEEEKKLYFQILNDLPSTSSVPVEEPNVFSDLLGYHFIERIEQEIKDLERHFRRIKDLILDKLSLTEKYESIRKQFELEVESYDQKYDPREIDQEAIVLPNFKRELVQKLEVSSKELTNYVRCVDQYHRIVVNVAVFIVSRLSDYDELCYHISYLFSDSFYRKVHGWSLLHFVTIIKQGRCFVGTMLNDHSIARISNKRARGESQQEAKWLQKCSTKKVKDGILKILRGIVEDLRCIGVSDIETDNEENQLLQKIWLNVASSAQFFLSAIAYEQRHYISKCGGLPDGTIPGLRTTRIKSNTTVEQITDRLVELAHEVADVSFILAALRDVLLEKTGKDGLHVRVT